jgi:hypothetical protein
MRALAAAAIFAALVSTASAQQPPRTADGKADLGTVWSNAGVAQMLVQTVDGKQKSVPLEDPLEKILPLRDPASAMAWRRKYGNYMTGAPQPDFTQGVDTLPNRDRCLMAANAAAPPMTSQGYNDAYQIVQTPSVIVISVEMMDETRIVPIFPSAAEARRSHGPQALQRWTGDSTGWWEGDTLVVETVNVNPRQGSQSPFPTSKDATVTERFTRKGASALSYEAEVTDPAIYSRPWSVSYDFHRTPRLWEYACHEGNYDVTGILSTARRAERKAAKK